MSEEFSSETPLEILAAQQKKERKELQAKIQSLKHCLPKGDKKKKKELNVTIAQLEADLNKKHEDELFNLRISSEAEMPSEIVTAVSSITTESDDAYDNSSGSSLPAQRISKAQRRREKKVEKEKDRSKEIAQQEVVNLTGARNVENEQLVKLLEKNQLNIYEIPSDGDCMYAAISHQLNLQDINNSVQRLRQDAADYMRNHQDDFLPFLSNQNTGDPLTEDEYAVYCKDVADTKAWGGQIELRAMSEVLKKQINVLQANSPIMTVGKDYTNESSPPLMLSYHRHAYGLGEHYNSLIRS